jgi:hypothetical protein
VSGITGQRATLYGGVDAYRDNACLIEQWLKKWELVASLRNQDEYCWDVEAPIAALQELPRRLFAVSDWSTYPLSIGGTEHPLWRDHFDDGAAT